MFSRPGAAREYMRRDPYTEVTNETQTAYVVTELGDE